MIMKKLYIGIIGGLLVVGVISSVYVWHILQTLHTQVEVGVPEEDVPRIEEVNTEESVTLPPPVVIEKESLSEAQQDTLSGLGLDGDTITITGEMIQCAYSALGESRVVEILKGDSPSPLEVMKLLPCSKE